MESDSIYKITYTDCFLKSFNKLAKTEQLAFEKKIMLFIKNNLRPSLRTKKIQGQKELYESSINMNIRIIWFYENQELIVLVDIDHHDILKEL